MIHTHDEVSSDKALVCTGPIEEAESIQPDANQETEVRAHPFSTTVWMECR